VSGEHEEAVLLLHRMQPLMGASGAHSSRIEHIDVVSFSFYQDRRKLVSLFAKRMKRQQDEQQFGNYASDRQTLCLLKDM
jgi:hypothetical protein